MGKTFTLFCRTLAYLILLRCGSLEDQLLCPLATRIIGKTFQSACQFFASE